MKMFIFFISWVAFTSMPAFAQSVVIYDPFAEDDAAVAAHNTTQNYTDISADNIVKDVPLGWSGRVNFGGFITDGNTDKRALTLDGLAKARGADDRYTVGAELSYAEDNGDETENDYMVYGEYDRFLTEKAFIGGRVSYEADKIADLKSRIKVGPYAGYQFYESDDHNLLSRIGLDYLAEDFEGGTTDNGLAANWGVDYDQKFFDDAVQIFYKHDFSLPVDEVDAFIFESELGARFPVAEVLTGTAQIDFDWDNAPAADIKENDTKYSLKLGYEF